MEGRWSSVNAHPPHFRDWWQCYRIFGQKNHEPACFQTRLALDNRLCSARNNNMASRCFDRQYIFWSV
jgi:hypothetical protein